MHVLEDRTPSAAAAAAGVRPCRNRQRRTAPRESASRSPSRAWLAGGPCRRSGRAAPGTDRSARCPAAPWTASNCPPRSRRRDRYYDQTIRSIRKKRNQQRPLSCKRNNLTILGGASKIRRVGIVHGRLASRSQSRGLSAWMKPLCIRDRPRRRADSRKSGPRDRRSNGTSGADTSRPIATGDPSPLATRSDDAPSTRLPRSKSDPSGPKDQPGADEPVFRSVNWTPFVGPWVVGFKV